MTQLAMEYTTQQRAASMRPRHEAADDEAVWSWQGVRLDGFNEAAARSRG